MVLAPTTLWRMTTDQTKWQWWMYLPSFDSVKFFYGDVFASSRKIDLTLWHCHLYQLFGTRFSLRNFESGPNRAVYFESIETSLKVGNQVCHNLLEVWPQHFIQFFKAPAPTKSNQKRSSTSSYSQSSAGTVHWWKFGLMDQKFRSIGLTESNYVQPKLHFIPILE